MIEIFLPNSRAILPTFHTNCPEGSHFDQTGLILPRWVSFCPQHHPQPMFFTQQSHTPVLDMYLHKTPQNPPQNTCFPGLNLKVGKMNYHLGNLDPTGKFFEKWTKLF